ncbi:hypothetical protein PHYBOEH_006265 [Phytophthora boehmeriae]|uniref:RNA-polymerase II-associated protein 3-like C-terminal domain-containing protein n=1 Tax=Phytophthora boehmeriae TaxID=109152 RepID=A0A8T1X302_9STRA|nr:hypothetical protein PHYBOEH_006265 [Phytophthora boehmeriae]
MKEETPSVVNIQHQIRANAAQLQDYFSDLYEWEKSIGKDDSARQRTSKAVKASAASTEVPPPRPARSVNVDTERKANAKKPDAHTYDKGYKRWEKFDVDAALKEADGEMTPSKGKQPEPAPAPHRIIATSKSATVASSKSREELEREEGNAHYKRGDYVAAIKSYTRCLGYNPQNAVVLSNRAMAYLKNREFANAEDDCSLALKADPSHVKSYSRRGTARNSLGKHRLALLDFERAAALDPKSRQIQTQLQSTRELIRTAIKRSPKRSQFSIEVVGESPSTKLPVPEQTNDTNDNKDNVCSRQGAGATPGIAQANKQTSPLQKISPTPPPQAATVPKKVSILPKLPKKAPTTSYEFGRVWKTFILRGDSEQQSRLIDLRAKYLRMIDPLTLPTVFKTGMESDVLCEIFHVFRHALLSSSGSSSAVSEETIAFVFAFANQLTQVPRFNMTIMLLSASEKEDMSWVVTRLETLSMGGTGVVANLKKQYELPDSNPRNNLT